MWVDPTAILGDGSISGGYYASATYSTNNTDLFTQINYVDLRTKDREDNQDKFLFDELSVGTGLSDVLGEFDELTSGPDPGGAPEPVTMVGLMLGIGGLSGYIRRRRRA